MGFNNSKERNRFENKWKRLYKQYRDAGFSEEGIIAMRNFDEDIYRSNRRFEEHNQQFSVEDFSQDDFENEMSLYGNLEYRAITVDAGGFESRYAWVEMVSDPCIAFKLKMLKDSDLELLTLIIIEGYSQTDVACKLCCSQKNISVKYTRIKKYLKNT